MEENQSHQFVDLNVYYTDDELRKQGENLCGKLVVTGQEMPDCNKEMKEEEFEMKLSPKEKHAELDDDEDDVLMIMLKFF